jgi:hypothetical protein
MNDLKKNALSEIKPKELIKPLKIEEVLENEKVLEALCESRNTCRVNTGMGDADDILF